MERNLLIIMHQAASSYKENVRHPVNAGSLVIFTWPGSRAYILFIF